MTTQQPETIHDPRWGQVLARDGRADGQFFYGVKTTGVYCRPSCPSRRANPDNVEFFDDALAAQRAGYRACRRCRPEALTGPGERIAELCRYIESAETAPSLQELAERAGLSRYHLQRLFKAQTGLSPAAYARGHRARRLQDALRQSDSVTAAAYDAGYESSSRFYADSSQWLGMTPSRFRQGGHQATIRFVVGQCALGAILVASSERGVCAISLGDEPESLVTQLQDRFANAELVGGDAEFERLVARVVGLVESPGLGLELPLDIRGTAFQQRVWQALQAIPAGTTASYSEIAERIGQPSAVRAVAGACAANTLAVAIPCHRVVRSDGSLSGYRWGIERKRALLKRERERERDQDRKD
ncbi:bifunctional DNA-binding transcriptional regulator/O6-methylguanine-DNA methyltransferase Ada [Marinobacter sp. SS21]|uniref:bifunctional DNA-binding transcriptional regulator/O6-methylguanine-DNA methyltransferase Ada n=1 Tax=Marinobacter sp. SS21 TaxID=2979460 RepID=UPI00232E95EC|nr:bifunctional DNA-binding transcriptional regulator/O6-methylguanine-DNA methyltransferase Ada [Marinobacter sp. SS21]MDC0661044.1 bifunctional DNA-binding transcriptional regulator/O6-methylguanine-DNA methyltransferase Ada [Marinobacter sp. SS21]